MAKLVFIIAVAAVVLALALVIQPCKASPARIAEVEVPDYNSSFEWFNHRSGSRIQRSAHKNHDVAGPQSDPASRAGSRSESRSGSTAGSMVASRAGSGVGSVAGSGVGSGAARQPSLSASQGKIQGK